MKNIKRHQNNLKALLEKRGMTSLVLAKKIGTSAPHMSRLINGQSPLSMKWLLKASSALKVPTSKIAGIDIDKKFAAKCDDTLLGSIMGWILEASDEYKIDLSREELTKLTSFVYKECVDEDFDFEQSRYLAVTAVRIKGIAG